MVRSGSVVLGAMFLAAACTSLPMDSSEQEQHSHASSSPELVARTIALAMADENVRVTLRNHMRASVVSEHKLHLQDYLAGPLGETLLAAIEGTGIERADFLAGLRSLPPIQFYVPARQQRLTWTGTPDVM